MHLLHMSVFSPDSLKKEKEHKVSSVDNTVSAFSLFRYKAFWEVITKLLPA